MYWRRSDDHLNTAASGKCALRMPPRTPLDLRSSCRRLVGLAFIDRLRRQSTLCSDQAGHDGHSGTTTRHKGSASALPPFTLSTHERRLWLAASSPMKSSLPRHHWAVVRSLPAVRRTPALHEQGRNKVERTPFLIASSRRKRVCINRAQRRADARRRRCRLRARVPRLPLDGSRLSRSHSEGFGRGTARQQRVARKGRALMQRFCQAFASAGGRGQRRMSTAAWYACRVLLAIWPGRQDAMRGRPFGQDRWRLRRCGLDAPTEGYCVRVCVRSVGVCECGSVPLSSRVGLPLPAVCRVPRRLVTVACLDCFLDLFVAPVGGRRGADGGESCC